jgi:hypothetical protein
MSDDNKVVCLLHEVVDECETNSEVIFAGMALMRYGYFNESYDVVISRLIDEVEVNRKYNKEE